jgi:hypothetical protein
MALMPHGCEIQLAPADKDAADPKQAQKADKDMHDKLHRALRIRFASDPVSSAQPKKSKTDADPSEAKR